MKRYCLFLTLLLLSMSAMTLWAAQQSGEINYNQARWDPLHFQPAIATATNKQCLSCHQEVLTREVLTKSPAGVPANDTLAWYQTLTTYEGPQKTFHQRHLTTDLSKKLMNMQCNTCHQGNDPREQAVVPPNHNKSQYTLRKQVNPEVCLMCHGDFPDNVVMGLPGPWETSKEIFQNNCLLCHAGIRSNRHQVNFLNAEAIETAGKENSDVCYGCHGGRQWYRIQSPYPRHSWPGMAKEVPEWAKDRPTESNPRFRITQQKTAKK